MTRLVSAAMAVALSVVSSQSLFAAPKKTSTTPNPIQVAAKAKLIKFAVRNDSKQAMTVRDGDVEVTVAPGQTAQVKLPEGTPMIAVTGSPFLQPGTTITSVSSVLKGNTLAIR